MEVFDIPKLDPSSRSREYKDRTYDEISEIVYIWLFHDNQGHREIDASVLGLDPLVSKGWQSMGVLHYLGLKKQFKALFQGHSLDFAINSLARDSQDFSPIIELLEMRKPSAGATICEALEQYGLQQSAPDAAGFKYRLEQLNETERVTGGSTTRREQSLLRAILFGAREEMDCSLCHRILPIDLLVAAHIKPRSLCTLTERKNARVVMPACKIGCDDFFERGYLIVDEFGQIRPSLTKVVSTDLREILSGYEGKKCLSHDADSKHFFDEKRTLVG